MNGSSGEPVSEARASFVDLVVNPRAFFEALDPKPVNLLFPGLIVLVTGVIGAVTAYQMSAVLMDAMALPGIEGLGGVVGAVGAIGALITTLLAWVIYTAVFFVVSMAFRGSGEFNRLLSYVGYGHVPQVIGGIVSTVLTWNFVSNLRIPTLTDPEAVQEWSATLTQDPTMQAATIISLLFMLWSANIWIFGVRQARNLSTRDAAITVLVPVLIYLLASVVPMLVT